MVDFEAGEGAITIYDINGRNVITQKVNSAQTELNTSALNKGIYMVEVQNKNEVWREKIVKN